MIYEFIYTIITLIIIAIIGYFFIQSSKINIWEIRSKEIIKNCKLNKYDINVKSSSLTYYTKHDKNKITLYLNTDYDENIILKNLLHQLCDIHDNNPSINEKIYSYAVKKYNFKLFR